MLAKWAEELGFRARIEVNTVVNPQLVYRFLQSLLRQKCQSKEKEDNWSARLFRSLRIPNSFAQEIPGEPVHLCYTYPFRQSKVAKYVLECSAKNGTHLDARTMCGNERAC